MFRRWPGAPSGVLAAALLALSAGGAPALAQPAPAPTYGPPISGVCLFSQGDALGKSQMGVSANQQLAQFAKGADAELGAQQSAIGNDAQALAKQKATLAAATYNQRVGELRARYDDLNRTKQMRQAQLMLTKQDALNQVGKVLSPSLVETITARRCSLVLDKGGVYGAAEGMDITPVVIQRMDGLQTSITLRLATPEAVKAAAAAAQPKPAS